MGKLVLIRHGQSMGNAWQPAYLNPEMNFLTELGETQAKLAGLKLRQTGLKFDLMISSSITRARHTLAILAHQMDDWMREFVVEPGFNERLSADHLMGPNEAESLPGEHKFKVAEAYGRLVKPLMDEGKHVLVVSHYYTMQVLFHLLGVDQSNLWGAGDHIPNAVPFIWDPMRPSRMTVLNDETRVTKY